MAETKADRLKKVHERALRQFNCIQTAVKDEREQCLQDRRFYSIPGAQWEGDFGEQFANKPRLEVNKVHLSVIRIINEYRNNRITVNFQSKEGVENDRLADTCDNLYRADEQRSTADEAYDNAFEESAGGGMGAWRLRAEYEDEEDDENEYQRICMEPIYDADTCVFFNLGAKKQDKSDAKHCYVLTSMTPDAYQEEWNDDPTSWPKDISNSEFDWVTDDAVFVAEYYEIEEKKRTIHVWESVTGEERRISDDELTDEKRQELETLGFNEARTKRVKKKQVHKYIMSGGGVLSDEGLIAGPNIPIVVTYGKRWIVDNVERCMGHVRLAKDAQRLKNMQLSKLAEISAQGSVEKPIFTGAQVAGHEEYWRTDNVSNYAYLTINPTFDAEGNEIASGPIAYTKTATVPQALAALLELTEADIQDLLGNQQGGEQIEGNISTETAMLIQNRLDMQSFIYMSNMAKAVKRSGEIWLGMARELLVEQGRKMRGVGSQGEQSVIELVRPVMVNGEKETENDLSKASLEVFVDVGPSSSTRRASTVRALSNMLKLTDDPETKQVISAMVMMNMEGEGVTEVREYFRRKLIKMGVVKPNEQEKKELQAEADATPPSPQDEYLRSAAAAEQAKAVKTQAEIISEGADAEKTRAETAQILAEIDTDRLRSLLDLIDKLGPTVQPPIVEGSRVE